MGCGMIIAVDSTVAQEVSTWLNERLEGSTIIGELVSNGHKVTHQDSAVFFEHY